MKNSALHFRRALIASAAAVGLGSSPALLFAAETTEPVAHSDSAGAAVSDAMLTTRIKAHLLGKKMLHASDVEVTTTNGVVTLTGEAGGPKAMAYAVDEVRKVEGVKSVDNNMTMKGRSKTSATMHKTAAKVDEQVSDSWITTKVKADLLADSVSKGASVSVATTDGVVVLTGSLASQAAIGHVKGMAEKVSGVKSVDTNGLTVAAK